jgi:two-component system sensor histidine kinase DesK
MRLLPGNEDIGYSPFTWLVYLSFLLIQPVLGGNTVGTWLIIVASLAIFLPLYFRFYWETERRRLIAAAIGVIGLAVMPFNPGGSTYIIYSAALIPWAASSSRRAVRGLAMLLAATAGLSVALNLPFWAWMPAVTGILAVGGGNIHIHEVQRQHMLVRRANEEIQEMAKVAERERIARDLHDLLGHTLSVIVMKAELASKLADRDFARAIQEIRDVERVSREGLTEVRRAVEGYRQHGLAGEVHNAAGTFRSAGVTFEADLAPVALAPRQETALALALREAVTNVVRHARATVCRVSLSAEGSRLVFSIHDNGHGGTPLEGNGLNGMRTRVAEAGGSLSIDGSDGMRVVITIPLRPQAAATTS